MSDFFNMLGDFFGYSPQQRLARRKAQMEESRLLGANNSLALLGVGDGTYTDPQTGRMSQIQPETTYTPQGGGPIQPQSIGQQLFAPQPMTRTTLLDDPSVGGQQRVKQLLGSINPELPLQQLQSKIYPKPDDVVFAPAGSQPFNKTTMQPVGERIPEKPGEADPLTRLIMARDALPADHPNRKLYDAAIAKATKTEGDGPAAAPAGYRWLANGNLAPIPGGPADKPAGEQAPPTGYSWTPEGTLKPIPGGPADIGQKGAPQKYKDAVTAFDSLEPTIKEYEDLANKVGTEWWDAESAARLESLETQMKFGIKGVEQTGALDKGSIDVMGGMIPSATGLSAMDPRGGKKLKAKIDEFKKYVKRSRAALETGYNMQSTAPATNNAATGWSAKVIN